MKYHFDGFGGSTPPTFIQDNSPRPILAEMAETVARLASRASGAAHRGGPSQLGRHVPTLETRRLGARRRSGGRFPSSAATVLAGDPRGLLSRFHGIDPGPGPDHSSGLVFTGQYSGHSHKKRGTNPSALSPATFVVFLQNHDQIGNRAWASVCTTTLTWRLTGRASALPAGQSADAVAVHGAGMGRAQSVSLLTDHNPRLGKLVTEGRARESSSFPRFPLRRPGNAFPTPRPYPPFNLAGSTGRNATRSRTPPRSGFTGPCCNAAVRRRLALSRTRRI